MFDLERSNFTGKMKTDTMFAPKALKGTESSAVWHVFMAGLCEKASAKKNVDKGRVTSQALAFSLPHCLRFLADFFLFLFYFFESCLHKLRNFKVSASSFERLILLSLSSCAAYYQKFAWLLSPRSCCAFVVPSHYGMPGTVHERDPPHLVWTFQTQSSGDDRVCNRRTPQKQLKIQAKTWELFS